MQNLIFLSIFSSLTYVFGTVVNKMLHILTWYYPLNISFDVLIVSKKIISTSKQNTKKIDCTSRVIIIPLYSNINP